MSKEITTETVTKESKVVKLGDKKDAKPPVIDQKKVDAAQKALDDFNKSIEDKKYGVSIKNKEGLAILVNFLENDAKWKFTEALGIIESLDKIKTAKMKSENIFLGSLEIEAIYYFLSKHEGTGFKEAERFKKILKPINDALASIRKDTDKIRGLESNLVAAEQGVDLAEGNSKDKKA